METIHDLIIIGGGPAGLTAGLYASRARLRTLLFERQACGGYVTMTHKVENYPGISETTGFDLAAAFHRHALRFGLSVEQKGVVKIELVPGSSTPLFRIFTEGDRSHDAYALIIATGGRWRKLGVPGEKELTGRGVSYCATCDGPLFKDRDVVVVGGGNTAVEEALFLAKFARNVTLVHRRSMLRATKVLQEEFTRQENTAVRFESVIERIEGENTVEKVVLRNTANGEKGELSCSGVFVFLGQEPNNELVRELVETDERGFIVTDREMRTRHEGVFAAGDVRGKLLRQIVTAASDGAVAAFSAEQYLRKLKGEEYK